MANTTASTTVPYLNRLDPSKAHTFITPAKKIIEGHDVSAFLTSKAYRDIMTFVLQLNASMFPRCMVDNGSMPSKTQAWELGSPDVVFSNPIIQLRQLLSSLNGIIDEVPPDKGPRRFGNVSFRKWFQTVEGRISDLLADHLPSEVLSFSTATELSAKNELEAYLLGSFGSPQRLDYGTGHELSFLAFLGSIWKLGGFESTASGIEERAIVLGVIEPYLDLIRRLIKNYTLEPAGSHGVWGLDDHSFVPYIFGSAQLAPAISSVANIPAEGSLIGSPDPADVTKATVVERERKRNMYFGAIGFIYDVKKGPFWEHSPMLYDISGVRAGWAKINKGMIKMYSGEVLSKFPVVQHFPFGSLFSWDQDPIAMALATSVHTSSQPSTSSVGPASTSQTSRRRAPQDATSAPWAGQSPDLQFPAVQTAAPWTGKPALASTVAAIGRQIPTQIPMQVPTKAPWPGSDTRSSAQGMPPTQALWATGASNPHVGSMLPPTTAPWAKPGSGTGGNGG